MIRFRMRAQRSSRLNCFVFVILSALCLLGLMVTANAQTPTDPALCYSTATPANPTGTTACPLPITATNPPAMTPYNRSASWPGTSANPIDVWGYCRYVDNPSLAQEVLVPYGTALEWIDFINNHPASYITLTTCARSGTYLIYPTAACQNPTPPFRTVDLPYARTGTTNVQTATFICAVAGICDSYGCATERDWTQTETITYTAEVAPDAPGGDTTKSWSATIITTTGVAPAACYLDLLCSGNGGSDCKIDVDCNGASFSDDDDFNALQNSECSEIDSICANNSPVAHNTVCKGPLYTFWNNEADSSMGGSLFCYEADCWTVKNVCN